MTAPPDEEGTLVLTRIIDAPPERVFDAWISREEWQAWIGPEGVQCEVSLLEARVGGRYQISMHVSDGKTIRITGIYTIIDRPRTLAMTWGLEGDPSRQSLSTITLQPLGRKTELTLRQTGLRNASNRDDHGKGWHGALNKLDAHLARSATQEKTP